MGAMPLGAATWAEGIAGKARSYRKPDHRKPLRRGAPWVRILTGRICDLDEELAPMGRSRGLAGISSGTGSRMSEILSPSSKKASCTSEILSSSGRNGSRMSKICSSSNGKGSLTNEIPSPSSQNGARTRQIDSRTRQIDSSSSEIGSHAGQIGPSVSENGSSMTRIPSLPSWRGSWAIIGA